MVSIHAPRTGCDTIQIHSGVAYSFQFTHPARGATAVNPDEVQSMLVSIHAPRTGCDLYGAHLADSPDVSIHAPRTGCDCDAQRYA